MHKLDPESDDSSSKERKKEKRVWPGPVQVRCFTASIPWGMSVIASAKSGLQIWDQVNYFIPVSFLSDSNCVTSARFQILRWGEDIPFIEHSLKQH